MDKTKYTSFRLSLEAILKGENVLDTFFVPSKYQSPGIQWTNINNFFLSNT